MRKPAKGKTRASYKVNSFSAFEMSPEVANKLRGLIAEHEEKETAKKKELNPSNITGYNGL